MASCETCERTAGPSSPTAFMASTSRLLASHCSQPLTLLTFSITVVKASEDQVFSAAMLWSTVSGNFTLQMVSSTSVPFSNYQDNVSDLHQTSAPRFLSENQPRTEEIRAE